MSTRSLEQTVADLESSLRELVKQNRYFYGPWPGLSREALRIEREIDRTLNLLEASGVA